ncbi:MAG: hypothetical protein DWP94_07315 [Flavobacterium sp.]|nr:MAG: hypothetical protein DWP94_07315 [Flavobacterium sp.]
MNRINKKVKGNSGKLIVRIALLLTFCFIIIGTSNAQVGINTTNPTKELDINGELRIRSLPQLTDGDVLTTDASGNIGRVPVDSISTYLGESIYIRYMPIPICNNVLVGSTGNYTAIVDENFVNVDWEILEKHDDSNATVTIDGVELIRAPYLSQRLLVRYTFSQPIPIEPNSLFVTIINTTNGVQYPDSYAFAFSAISTEEITVLISRTDSIADEGSACWTEDHFFNLLVNN